MSAMFNRICRLLNIRYVILSDEEWYEVRRAVISHMKRENEAIENISSGKESFRLPDDVLDRGRHGLKVQAAVLRKIP
jgi:hypothetical protein